MTVEIAAFSPFSFTMVVIDQRMIHRNRSLFQVNIAPAKPCCFTNAKSSTHHYRKNRIPMLILRSSFQVIKEKILLWNCQCFAFYSFKLLFFFQFSENIIRRIAPQIIIFDRRCQDLMQHRMDTFYCTNLQPSLICQHIVKSLYIGLFDWRYPRLTKVRCNELPINVQIVLISIIF